MYSRASGPKNSFSFGIKRRVSPVGNEVRLLFCAMAVAKNQPHQQQQQQQQQGKQHAPTKAANAGEANATTNLWETMLRDAMRKTRLPSATLVFVGPPGCGKSSLLDTFLEGSASAHNPSGSGAAAAALTSAVVAPSSEKGAEGGGGGSGSGSGSGSPGGGGGGSGVGGAAGAGVGAGGGGGGGGGDPIAGQAFHPVLSYAYLDATDPAEQGAERDDSPPRVSVWSCSELEFEPLLETVLRPEELSNTAVVVAVDLSRPWEVMDSVEKVRRALRAPATAAVVGGCCKVGGTGRDLKRSSMSFVCGACNRSQPRVCFLGSVTQTQRFNGRPCMR